MTQKNDFYLFTDITYYYIMYRITCEYNPENESYDIKVLLNVNDINYPIGIKTIKAEINGDQSVTFGTSRLPYYSNIFKSFIDDVKNNIPSQFAFDKEDDDNEGCFDGMFYAENCLRIITYYGSNNCRINISLTDANRVLIVEDLNALHNTLSEYATRTITHYRLVVALEDDDSKAPPLCS